MRFPLVLTTEPDKTMIPPAGGARQEARGASLQAQFVPHGTQISLDGLWYGDLPDSHVGVLQTMTRKHADDLATLRSTHLEQPGD